MTLLFLTENYSYKFLSSINLRILVFLEQCLVNLFCLTPIRVAGGVYDFRNFEEVWLSNGLSSELQNSCIPRKTSREYILLSTHERKTAFLVLYRPKHVRNRPFFRPFSLFRTAVKVYMTSRNLSTTTSWPGTPPASSRRTKQFWSRPHGL